ncbi:toxin-antitoxin system HicB family antitoxin [Acinetobacter baumannii]|uniref:toxin-antitoxin system HicB family antitoxin n=1 Tax=Acinetobacter baumannii TaxID=470 RepID=UPI000A47589A|nr:toxin-antitoxin system HicB family antitoxin [Acinetobacter baumannii]MDC4815653.1 toxin-antitoxin system HicB family antitoxin [Acinetobacter baumannii]MDO7187299.1 toxin-antitoxin system HicB family antitoxin [Acinetobacter baumannii]
MESKKFVYVKVRLEVDSHKQLKAKAECEERSMNYLINKAVKLLIAQEGAKA